MFRKFHTNTNKNYLILSCILSASLIPLNSTMLACALPDIGAYFNVNISTLTMCLINMYLLINILFQVLSGSMGDAYGRKNILYAAHFLMISGVILASLKFNFSFLVLARILMAIGGSAILSNTVALICEELSGNERASALSFFSSSICLSAAFGPLIGGVVTQYFGWQSLFYINLPFLLFSLSIIIKNKGLFNKSLNPKIIKFTETEFVKRKTYKNYKFIISNITIFSQNIILYGLIFGLPTLLNEIFNFDTVAIAGVIFAMTISMAFAALFGKRIGDLIRKDRLLMLELFLTLIGLVLFYLSLQILSIPLLLLSLCLIGASVGMGYVTALVVVMSVSPIECRGLVSGITSTIRYIGGVLGVSIFSIILKELNINSVFSDNQLCILIYAAVCIFSLVSFQFFFKKNTLEVNLG